jgi:hypothetical protein
VHGLPACETIYQTGWLADHVVSLAPEAGSSHPGSNGQSACESMPKTSMAPGVFGDQGEA